MGYEYNCALVITFSFHQGAQNLRKVVSGGLREDKAQVGTPGTLKAGPVSGDEGLVWPGVKEGRAGPGALGGRWLLTPPLWAFCSTAPGLSPSGRPRYLGGPDLRVAL